MVSGKYHKGIRKLTDGIAGYTNLKHEALGSRNLCRNNLSNDKIINRIGNLAPYPIVRQAYRGLLEQFVSLLLSEQSALLLHRYSRMHSLFPHMKLPAKHDLDAVVAFFSHNTPSVI